MDMKANRKVGFVKEVRLLLSQEKGSKEERILGGKEFEKNSFGWP